MHEMEEWEVELNLGEAELKSKSASAALGLTGHRTTRQTFYTYPANISTTYARVELWPFINELAPSIIASETQHSTHRHVALGRHAEEGISPHSPIPCRPR